MRHAKVFPPVKSSRRNIELRGVRVNNLQDIDLDIEHGQWLALCGLSGSGKSSLAFDTLYAEGQRRYLESLSTKTRQFVDPLDKPDADRIDGLPPAIAVCAPRGTAGPRTTVGSASEVENYLRLLYSKIATATCPDCKVEITSDVPESAAAKLSALPSGTKYQVAFQIPSDQTASEAISEAIKNGFIRAIHSSKTIELSGSAQSVSGDARIWIVTDRLSADSADSSRVTESLETAFYFGRGQCLVLIDMLNSSEPGSGPPDSLTKGAALTEVDGRPWQLVRFSNSRICGQCELELPDLEPRLFSKSTGSSVCQSCQGSGKDDLNRCSDCGGTGFHDQCLAYRVGGKDFSQTLALRVESANEFFDSLELSSEQAATVKLVLRQLRQRIEYLNQVGLGYLSFDRLVRTLSSGESQRVSLTSVLSSTLVNMLYVLDEPSIGLHRHNVRQLVDAIGTLCARGNTLIVVDHEESVIRAAQRVVEIGPLAGAEGGTIVFDGTVQQMIDSEESLTGDFLGGRRGIPGSAEQRRPFKRTLRLVGASGNNLKDIDVEFPLGVLCLVTGVSGSGKSSLVQNTLYGAVAQRIGKTGTDIDGTLPFEDVYGESGIHEVVLIDQSPIGRSSRSNPVTYVKAFDDIRQAFAETVDAKTRSITAGHFSFNVTGGRCEKCKGDGQLSVDMQFMSDIWMTCSQCHGTRYRDEVLSVKYRDKNIAQVLNLTVRQAFSFFRGQPKVQTKLKALIDVGLAYIRLGQPASTLSSGEAQRLKLALYLNASKNKRVLFVMDEPTSGLHMDDVTRLVDCFDNLLAVGHSMIVVEHNLHFIKHADWIIDLGPGAAEQGGTVVAEGTPEEIVSCPESLTGRYLKEVL